MKKKKLTIPKIYSANQNETKIYVKDIQHIFLFHFAYFNYTFITNNAILVSTYNKIHYDHQLNSQKKKTEKKRTYNQH